MLAKYSQRNRRDEIVILKFLNIPNAACNIRGLARKEHHFRCIMKADK